MKCFRSAADGGSTVKDGAWLKERLAGGMQRSSQMEQAAKDAGISSEPSPCTRSAQCEDKERTLTDGGLQLPPQLAEPESEGSQESKDANSLHGGKFWHPLKINPRMPTWHPWHPSHNHAEIRTLPPSTATPFKSAKNPRMPTMPT